MPLDNLSRTAGLTDTAYAELATVFADTAHNPPCGPLCAHTMASLRNYFDQQNHHPSVDHWQALEDVARTMEDMVNGTAP